MTDAELIAAIQNASKQEVNAADLPSAATAVLSTEFSERYNERTLLANGLGYEVRMADRTDDGSSGDDGDRTDDGSYVYFDLDGRQLGDRIDDGSGGDDDRDRPNDGSNYDCPDLSLNIGDTCYIRDANGTTTTGTVDANCDCIQN